MVLTLIGATTLGFACKDGGETSPLIDDLSSGQTMAAVTNRLGDSASQLTAEPTEELHGGQQSGGVRVDRLHLPAYRHLDHEGSLTLTFYNDRLVTTIFRPVDSAAYVSSLGEAYGNDFSRTREVKVEPSTTVWFTTNQKAGSFAGWEDRELMEQYDTYAEK